LLRYAINASPDLRVCSIAGVESEISMEFGGLHQLLLPFLPLLDDLPPPQRGALRVAFGQQIGPPPERVLVGLATLTLLSRAAQDQPLLGLVLAYRGNLVEARAMGLDLVGESAGRGQGRVADVGTYIAAIADLFDGHYPAAVSRALAVVENGHAYTVERILPELVEAAFRDGQPAVAATAYETLSQRALAAGTPWGLGLRARCAALLTDGAEAEDSYREAISQLERCQMAVDRARAHLLYGQWLRRAKRRRGARAELRTAHEMFAAMGALRFADLAAAELSAAGEHARARTPETLTSLTPQESRIADLTAAGATNSEIAAQLFLSPSTVDYHLRKVFRKLGVTSRTQLADRLK
jgi:DNA-binding CsgD family transcriptional regulator